MIPNRYFFFLLPLLHFFAGITSAGAQCTTDAGTLNTTALYLCAGTPFGVTHNGNQTLDGDDILIFVAYEGGTPNAGNVFATSPDGVFSYQPAFLDYPLFRIAAVAGNNAGGTVDWNDPCISISEPVIISYVENLEVNLTVSNILTCDLPTASITATANQPVTYLWSDGQTGPFAPIIFPGLYQVTVTNNTGCTATAMATVAQDVAPPLADAGPDVVLTCATPTVVLAASMAPPASTFQWIGPNGFTSNQLNPTVSNPGVYTLVVTAPNGCTNTDEVFVALDAVSPLANAGPDAGIPCGGGPVTLDGSGSMTGPNFTYQWMGPGIISGSTTLFPVVDQPGICTLIVLNIVNGCSASDMVTVFPGPAIPLQNFTITPVKCFGGNDGAISLTTLPAGAQPPLTFQWTGPNTFTSDQQNISNIPGGTYNLVIADATSCSYYAQLNVSTPAAPITVSPTVVNASCASTDGFINLNITGGTPPYIVLWNFNGDPLPPAGPILQGIQPGVYTATLVDANGCPGNVPPIVITQPPLMTITFDEVSNTCSSVVVVTAITGGIPPYNYFWSSGASGPTAVFNSPGTYTVTVIDANGCTAIGNYNVQLAGGGVCGFLEGYVVRDTSANCLSDAGEPGLGGWLVRADGVAGTLYGVTNNAGKYLIGVPLGTYTVTAVLPNTLWELCPVGTSVDVDVDGDTFPVADIPVKKILDCPALTVSIGTNQLRRCFSNNYYFVDYCNDGTATAEDAFVLITLDPFLSPLSSSLPYTDLGNNVLRFNVGDLEPGECGSFSLQVQVSCNAVIGQTHCTEAHIYPDTLCEPVNTLWSGANLDVSSDCDADSVRFFILNTGTGDMTEPSDYIVIEDAIMLMQGNVQLDAGEYIILSFPANGSTWRVEVEQVPFHPNLSFPSLSVEGCSPISSFSTGFVTQFPVNDAGPWIDIDCTQNIGSYDPNDKQGFPVGYGTQHYIKPGTELEYLIRFQNTGTDTAFTVRIVDTLSAWLDPESIRPGASSHEYAFDLNGAGIVSFLFENILLPDSNVNQAGSNGFVKFSVSPRANAPLETTIENEAAIYFDFNEPVITNLTYHRLGLNFVVRAWQPHLPGATVTVSPNPFGDAAVLEVKGLRSSAPLRLQVFDLQGNVVQEMETSGAVFHLKKGDWPAGIYFFHIQQEGKLVGSGKLVAE